MTMFILFVVPSSENPDIKYAAIDALYRKHHDNKLHQFTEKNRDAHISNWKLVLFIFTIKSFIKNMIILQSEEICNRTSGLWYKLFF